MKRLFLLLTLFAVTFAAQAETLEQTRDVLKWVESENDPQALGDWRDGIGYTAFGVLQIRKIAIDDVNRVYGTEYNHYDAFIEECADEIFELYISHWTSKLEKREGREATTEDIVRIWNGGPRGYQRASTRWYLKKFLNYRKNRYLCEETKEDIPESINRWEVSYRQTVVHAYGRCYVLWNPQRDGWRLS